MERKIPERGKYSQGVDAIMPVVLASTLVVRGLPLSHGRRISYKNCA
jgi:hypothetical protein